jgi:hypothetical protein
VSSVKGIRIVEATKDLGRATIRLKLEEGTQPLIDSYHRVQGLWFTYQAQVPEADRRHDHKEVAETLQKLEYEVEGIIAMAKADLDSLGKPI